MRSFLLQGCQTALYKAPSIGQSVDLMQPIEFAWDSSCIDHKLVDIYLYAPGANNARIHFWQSVANRRSKISLDIEPRWWNATNPQNLQLAMVPAGEMAYKSPYLRGAPVFSGTFTTPEGPLPAKLDPSRPASVITQINDAANPGPTPGGKAAAVIIPLLFLALCGFGYIKWKRIKESKKSKTFKEQVDRRMSTMSTDWKSVTPAGATAAIRNSIAVGSRNSSFSFGALRASTYAVEGDETDESKSTSHMRTGVGLRNAPGAAGNGERVSRISFAPDTRVSRVSFAESGRPSTDSKRARPFHEGHVPPVPALPDSALNEKEDQDSEGAMSPRQTHGPMSLSTEDIRSRIGTGSKHQKNDTNGGKDMDDVLPALSMMRSGNDPTKEDDFLFTQQPAAAPALPPKAVTSPKQVPSQLSSPVMSTIPMQPMPANVMSPDEMLRAYAERKKSLSKKSDSSSSITSPKMAISYPLPAATTTSRPLYDAQTGVVGTHTSGQSQDMSDAYDYNSVVPDSYYPPQSTDAGGVVDYSTHGYSAAYGAYGTYGHQTTGSVGVGVYGGAQYSIGEDDEDVGVAGRGVGQGTATNASTQGQQEYQFNGYAS